MVSLLHQRDVTLFFFFSFLLFKNFNPVIYKLLVTSVTGGCGLLLTAG